MQSQKLNPIHLLIAGLAVILAATDTRASAADDIAAVAALDTQFQAAVERNDVATMDRILHPDFILVLGDGRVVDRATLIEGERSFRRYEQQVEDPGTQQVRLFGPDTAVVTARLWIKGHDLRNKAAFDFRLWFSDTYVRTKDGWKYAFGQASMRMPEPVRT